MTGRSVAIGDLTGSLSRLAQPRRDEILVKLAALFDGVGDVLPEDGVETFDAIFVTLLLSTSEQARAVLSETLAPRSRAPGRSVRYLAFDDSIVVARPVLRLSPLLLNEQLLALATVKSPEHLLAICERSSLSSSVTDVMISRGDGRVRLALAGNAGAEFSPAGRRQLAEAAQDDAGLYDVLLQRSDVADELDDVDDSGTGAAATPDTRGRSQAAASAQVRPVEAMTMYERLSALQLTIRDLLSAGQVDAALGELAKALDAPTICVAKAYAVDPHGGFLAYAKAARLNWETVLRLLVKRYEAGQITPRLQRAEADYGRLQVADARRVMHMLVEHGSRPN